MALRPPQRCDWAIQAQEVQTGGGGLGQGGGVRGGREVVRVWEPLPG